MKPAPTARRSGEDCRGVRVVPHRGITVTRMDEMAELIRDDSSFADCKFDGGSFAGLCADALDMTDCSLQDADFSHLVCGELRISHCDLQRARFRNADIMESHFTDSNCASAKFQNAKMNLSRLTGCDFSLCSFEGASPLRGRSDRFPLPCRHLWKDQHRWRDHRPRELRPGLHRPQELTQATPRRRRLLGGRPFRLRLHPGRFRGLPHRKPHSQSGDILRRCRPPRRTPLERQTRHRPRGRRRHFSVRSIGLPLRHLRRPRCGGVGCSAGLTHALTARTMLSATTCISPPGSWTTSLSSSGGVV